MFPTIVALGLKTASSRYRSATSLIKNRFHEQADPPVHRNGLSPADELLGKEDPCGHAARLRAKNRLVPAGLLHSMLVGSNSGYVVRSSAAANLLTVIFRLAIMAQRA